MDVEVKLFKREDKGDFLLVQNLTKVEADFNRVIQLGNQLTIAAEVSATEENLSLVLISTWSEDIMQQFNLAHKVFDVVNQTNREICVNLLRQKVKNVESSFALFRIIVKEMEEEKFQHIVHVEYKLEEIFYLLDLMEYVYDKVNTNESICNDP